MSERKIVHVDMDAFYASIEQRDNPHLKNKPVIVGGCSKRGVVCAASYEARKNSIRSAMATEKARKLCPHGIFIPPRIKHYAQVSKEIMSILREYTDLVEPLSLDEAYLDVTSNKKGIPYASRLAKEIKLRILKEVGLVASAGVAPNKFIAKIASDIDKPDGLVVVPPEKVISFINPLPVGRIHGVGKVTEQKLVEMSILTIEDLAQTDSEKLCRKLGKMGRFLWDLANGKDYRPVNAERKIKSMGEEKTFEEDLMSPELIKKKLSNLISMLHKRLQKYNIRGKTITLKVKYHDFAQITRSRTLWFYTQDEEVIFNTVVRLFSKTEIGSKSVRLVGVSITQLLENPLYEQLLLFDPSELGDG